MDLDGCSQAGSALVNGALPGTAAWQSTAGKAAAGGGSGVAASQPWDLATLGAAGAGGLLGGARERAGNAEITPVQVSAGGSTPSACGSSVPSSGFVCVYGLQKCHLMGSGGEL
jgi:hypothetical protein